MATRMPEGSSRYFLVFQYTDATHPDPTAVQESVAAADVDSAQAKVADLYAVEGKTVVPNSYAQVINAGQPITII